MLKRLIQAKFKTVGMLTVSKAKMSALFDQKGNRKYLTKEERERFLKAAEKTGKEVRTF